MSFPRMSLHIGDYKRDTGHLRAAGHGAYLSLIMHYFSTGGLPDDDAQLAAIAGLSDREWKKHKPTIQAFFKDDWRHKRIDAELADARKAYARRSLAGKAGNAKRWSKKAHRHADQSVFGDASQCDRGNASGLRSPPLASPHSEESQQEKVSPPVEESVVEGQVETRFERGGV